MMPVLEGLRDALATIPGVASCKIGLEANISPADYPLIRVVPSRIAPGELLEGGSTAELLIYFGADIGAAESGGLEAVYTALFDLESAIRQKISDANGIYRETITDEDRLDTYKVMAVRCEVMG
jgi:hypothetical protein